MAAETRLESLSAENLGMHFRLCKAYRILQNALMSIEKWAPPGKKCIEISRDALAAAKAILEEK